jgi:CrcB protein
MIWTLTQVAIGGALGSVLRYLTVSAIGAPVGTAVVNIVGSLVMGALFVLLTPRLSPLLMAGILGGFTTFSAFSLDALKLYTQGQPVQALIYIAGTVLLSLFAVATGAALARGVLT